MRKTNALRLLQALSPPPRMRLCISAAVLLCPAVLLAAGPSPEASSSAAAVHGQPPAAHRLASERSPYLRQHAHNPVDWYPWGEEAFAKARTENKPLFVSIGYSTCHWCHVMEREAFSDPVVAELLNTHFISIKVDREERPDVDRVYMTFLQALRGEGGWPLNVFLTPERKPFFGGTYFPVETEGGQPGFKDVVRRVAAMWDRDHEAVVARAAQMLAALEADVSAHAAEERPVLASLETRALDRWRARYDAANGGFDGAPKFPSPGAVEFLLQLHARSTAPDVRSSAARLAEGTLLAMARGGLRDHLAGGFHRYAVDAAWQVPHFEKMLYDQAQLASVYLMGWRVLGTPEWREAAFETLDYVRRELTHPEGGFYSAEDADSAAAGGAHAEGAFYVWTGSELDAALETQDAALFRTAYGIEDEGNAGPEMPGRNVLRRVKTTEACAAHFALPPAAVEASLARSRARLLEQRAGRPRPARDDKVIAAWNGLMVSAFARSALEPGRSADATAAARAATFLRTHLWNPETGLLSRSWRAGARDEGGFAEDYAFVIQGLLDLYEASFDVTWLQWARQLQERQDALFGDRAAGGYFATRADDAGVVLRLKDDVDGAEPSANSVSLRNLARLAAMFHDAGFTPPATVARGLRGAVEREPDTLPVLLSALPWLEGSPQQVLIVGEAGDAATQALLTEVRQHFQPQRVVLLVDRASRAYLEEHVPIVRDLPAEKPGQAMAYVCRNFTCQLPTRDPAVLARQLVGK